MFFMILGPYVIRVLSMNVCAHWFTSLLVGKVDESMVYNPSGKVYFVMTWRRLQWKWYPMSIFR